MTHVKENPMRNKIFLTTKNTKVTKSRFARSVLCVLCVLCGYVSAFAQTRTTATLETDQTFTGVKTFGNLVNFDCASPAQITANQNDYALGAKVCQRFTSDASRTFTGFSATGAGVRFHILYNVGSFNIVLSHEDVLSAAANRIISATGANLTLTPNQLALITYDPTSTRWRAVHLSSGGGGSGTPGGADTQVQFNDAGAFGGDAGLTYNKTTDVLTASGGFSGPLTGTASLATALAANGANCAAGNFPLGVDASGAVESCTDAATQAELDTHNTNSGAHASGVAGNAATATALAANAANCAAGQASQGVNAAGAAEGCFTPGTSGITTSITFLMVTGAALVDTDDFAGFWENNIVAMTITEIKARTDQGSSTINIQRNDGSAVNICSSNLVATTSGATCTLDINEDNLAAGNLLRLRDGDGRYERSATPRRREHKGNDRLMKTVSLGFRVKGLSLFFLLFLLSTLIHVPSPLQAAVSVDAVVGNTTATATSISHSHTVGTAQGNRAIYALLTRDRDTDDLIGCTYSGQAMTLVAQADGAINSYILRRLNPSTGANTLECTATNSDQMGLWSISLYGVHQTTAEGTAQTAIGTGTSSSLTVSDAADSDFVIDVISLNDVQGLVLGANQTERHNAEVSTIMESAGSTQPGNISGDAMSWSWAGSENFAHAAIAVLAGPSVSAALRPQTIVVVASVVTPTEPPPSDADLFASPGGSGTTCSEANPCTLTTMLNAAAPGNVLQAKAGVYTGATGMITPNQNINGTQANPITLRCELDGACLIDGQGARRTFLLNNNDRWIIEGFNIARSNNTVVQLGTGADNNIVRRVVAWDAPDSGNNGIFLSNSNTGNLFEDVAGFGSGRNIFANSQGGNNAIFRRAWGRWERSTQIGGKVTFTNGYNAYGGIFENVIGTWDESAMGGVTIDQPVSIFRFGPINAGDPCHNAKYLGSIAYIPANAEADTLFGVVSSSNDSYCMTLKDVVVLIAPGTHLNLKPFNVRDHPSAANNFLHDTTEIGGSTSTVESSFEQINRHDVNIVPTGSTNVWDGSSPTGARVCKRYVNGVLTAEPLWPWPMNQRIIDAMQAAGKTPVDVTATMENLLGQIAAECRSDN